LDSDSVRFRRNHIEEGPRGDLSSLRAYTVPFSAGTFGIFYGLNPSIMLSKFLAKGLVFVEFHNRPKLKDHLKFLAPPEQKNYWSKMTICLMVDDFLNSKKRRTKSWKDEDIGR